MAIKAEATSIENIKPTFPKLMKSKAHGQIVLFSSSSAGVIVVPGVNGLVVGHYRETWYSESFEDYEGSVTLTND